MAQDLNDIGILSDVEHDSHDHEDWDKLEVLQENVNASTNLSDDSAKETMKE